MRSVQLKGEDMKISRILAGVAGLIVLTTSALLVACGDEDDGGSTASQPTAAVVNPSPTAAVGGGAPAGPSISIGDFSYSPAALSIPAGQLSINLRNGGSFPHTFTIDNIVNVDVQAGRTAVAQFTGVAGNYTFYCLIHGRSTMSGQLTVGAGGAAQPPSGPAAGSGTGGGDSDY